MDCSRGGRSERCRRCRRVSSMRCAAAWCTAAIGTTCARRADGNRPHRRHGQHADHRIRPAHRRPGNEPEAPDRRDLPQRPSQASPAVRLLRQHGFDNACQSAGRHRSPWSRPVLQSRPAASHQPDKEIAMTRWVEQDLGCQASRSLWPCSLRRCRPRPWRRRRVRPASRKNCRRRSWRLLFLMLGPFKIIGPFAQLNRKARQPTGAATIAWLVDRLRHAALLVAALLGRSILDSYRSRCQ